MLDERLSDEDITNIKVRGSGCFDFIVTVIVAVIVHSTIAFTLLSRTALKI